MTENLNFEATQEKQKSKKEIAWEAKLKELDEIGDANGLGLDKHIKEVVAAFNVNGFNTGQSCEGHTDSGYGAPWIRVEAPNEPEERFIGERKIYEDVAKKYGVSYEDVRRANNQEAWIEAVKLCNKQEEAPEFKVWRKESEKLRDRINELVNEFYKERKVGPETHVHVEEVGAQGDFRVRNGGDDYNLVERMKESQKKGLDERLQKYREEIQAFGQFLKNKFLENDH